jgi:hypothetical protein
LAFYGKLPKEEMTGLVQGEPIESLMFFCKSSSKVLNASDAFNDIPDHWLTRILDDNIKKLAFQGGTTHLIVSIWRATRTSMLPRNHAPGRHFFPEVV